MKKNITFAFAITLVFIFLMKLTCSCSSGESNDASKKENSNDSKKINITLLIDLSDRIIRPNPNQLNIDLDIAEFLTKSFTDSCMHWESSIKGNGLQNAEHSFKIMFYPEPNDPSVNSLAAKLQIDASNIPQGKEKLHIIKDAPDTIRHNLNQIYNIATKAGNFHGSDIWGFFDSGDVEAQCIRKDYRNILVILTDGYLYERSNLIHNGNSTNYITDAVLKNPNSGLIANRNNLNNLEVLLLEINPKDPHHLQKMKSLLTDWIKKQGVKHCEVTKTQLQVNTQTTINNFLNNK